jgi:hypothetical protein
VRASRGPRNLVEGQEEVALMAEAHLEELFEKLKGVPGRWAQSWKPGDVRLRTPVRVGSEEKQELLGVPTKIVPGWLLIDLSQADAPEGKVLYVPADSVASVERTESTS